MPAAPHHRPVATRRVVLLAIALTCSFAALGYLVALLVPPPHEFVAFVRGGSLERDDVVPRADVLERINGLAAASDVARRLEMSPWQIWRRYSVTAEGQMYVVRVRTQDVDAGQRLVELVRDTLAGELKQRYDSAIAPHQSYIVALQAEVVQLGEDAKKLDMNARSDPRASSAAADRRVAVAQIRKQLRDAQLFAALSDPPLAVDGIRRLDIDRKSRQLQFLATGGLVGLIGALGGLVVLGVRARSLQAFAGV